MSTSDDQKETVFFQNSWQHLMGPLDAILDDARRNAAALPQPNASIASLLARAEQERAAAEEALRDLERRRGDLSAILDEVQRELAVAGVPLRGEIS